MRKPKIAKRTWIVTNLCTREIPKSRGKYLLRESASCPHAETLPKGFSGRQGFAWAEVTETICDPAHRGAPVFRQPDWQVARIARIVAKGE
jgi:hypothetical protein